jgi:hypothetical protein
MARQCGICGRSRAEALRPLLTNPQLKVFSTLVMDAATARELLKQACTNSPPRPLSTFQPRLPMSGSWQWMRQHLENLTSAVKHWPLSAFQHFSISAFAPPISAFPQAAFRISAFQSFSFSPVLPSAFSAVNCTTGHHGNLGSSRPSR